MLITTWELCECCEDHYCNFHDTHTGECDCPGIEAWVANDLDPYTPESLADVEEFLS